MWHVALAIAGSLIALALPIAGIVLLAVALISVLADAFTGRSLGRRLSPERASQNVIAVPAEPSAGNIRLVVTANYDAGRLGLAYRARPVTSQLVNALRGVSPGWIGWLAITIAWLLAIAALRQAGHTSGAIGALQFPPTVALLLGLALLIDLATGLWSPAAGDNATGVAAAMQVAESIAAAPPQNLTVELLLAGAGDAEQIGLRHHLRGIRRGQTRRWLRRQATARSHTIVVCIGASGDGAPHWWESDGTLIPLRYSATLRRACARIGLDEAHLELGSHRGRSNTGAYAARAAGLPALTIGCLDVHHAAPHSHLKTDTTVAVDRSSLGRTIQFALLLVDAIDAEVGRTEPRSAATPA
jgi:hypothetical protein